MASATFDVEVSVRHHDHLFLRVLFMMCACAQRVEDRLQGIVLRPSLPAAFPENVVTNRRPR